MATQSSSHLFNNFTEQQFFRFSDYFSLRSLCINSWRIAALEPDKLMEVELFWAPKGTATIPPGKLGFFKALPQVQDGIRNGSFTGLRHFSAAIHNVGQMTGAMENWNDLTAKPPGENADTNWIPESLEAADGGSNCKEEFPFLDNGVPWRTGSILTFPDRFAMRFHLIDRLVVGARVPGIFRRLELGEVLWPKEEYGPLPIPFFLQWNLLISIREFETEPGGQFITYARRPRFAGRSDRPHWREQHQIMTLGRKFKRQQEIVSQDNEAGKRGRKGTGKRKFLARLGDKLSDALVSAVAKEVKKRSAVAGTAAEFALKLAKAKLKKKAATLERQRKRGLKPTVRSKKVDDKAEVKARYEKEVKAASRGVKFAQVKEDKELARILRREKAAIKKQNRAIMATRRRWLKHQRKIEREKKQFARFVAKKVKQADKAALKKLSTKRRVCIRTQQSPRRRRRRR